jgi:SAM-dependent methyltransferase
MPSESSGSFLDVGCADGALFEDVVAWCAEAVFSVDRFGVDVSAELVAPARRRHPEWAERLFVGDAATWAPPRRWDYVRVELVYVGVVYVGVSSRWHSWSGRPPNLVAPGGTVTGDSLGNVHIPAGQGGAAGVPSNTCSRTWRLCRPT